MFDFIFGWRKASKCKKLIRKVQCRLQLLKNKRCCIVKQLRDDVGQLLKHGHYQSAFNRVEQIFKDECIVTVYDLLAQFCEFILLQLSYIRRNRDCPNDINEAVSSLIFASARCGDLPELLPIRKLFAERYGKRLESTALELLPGNLVNKQITENLSIKSVSNEVKYKLVDEIARTVLQTGPLALEFSSEQHRQQLQANKSSADDVVKSSSIAVSSQTEEVQQDASAVVEAEDNVVNLDISSEEKSFDLHNLPASEKLEIVESIYADSSTGNSTSNAAEEMIYLDDVEEFESPMNKGENEQDQRLFLFKSSVVIPVVEKCKVDSFGDIETEHCESSWDEKEMPRRSRKTRKVSGKRSRKRSVSLECTTGIKDIDCAIYYNRKSHDSRPNDKKMHHEDSIRTHHARERSGKLSFVGKRCCSLENTCRLCFSKNSPSKSKKRILSLEKGISSLEEEKVGKKVYYLISPENRLLLKRIWKLEQEEEGWDFLEKSSMQSCSTEGSPRVKKEMLPYSRAMTMPCERPKEHFDDDNAVSRSNSFPVQPSSPHVHPKLPDYDELAAKFMALKKANLLNKQK